MGRYGEWRESPRAIVHAYAEPLIADCNRAFATLFVAWRNLQSPGLR